MKHFEEKSEFDKRLQAMNQKFRLSEKEQKNVLHEINSNIMRDGRMHRRKSLQWKYYITSAAAIFILILLVTPLLNNNVALTGSDRRSSESNETGTTSNVFQTDSVMINILNNADFRFYELELFVYKNDKLFVHQGTMLADESEIKKGMPLSFELTEEDVRLEGEVVLEWVIVDPKSQEEVPIGKKESITLEKGKEYNFELHGDSIKDAYLTGE